MKDKAISITVCGGPWDCGTLSFPHFIDNWLSDGEVVRLMCWLAVLLPARFLVLIFVRGRVDPMTIVRKELGIEKNSDLFAIRTCDL
jgi:hypothetical protein